MGWRVFERGRGWGTEGGAEAVRDGRLACVGVDIVVGTEAGDVGAFFSDLVLYIVAVTAAPVAALTAAMRAIVVFDIVRASK